MERLTLPVGQTDFRAIRENGSYYIDKTDNISQIVREGAVSILFTRPRRFGKTTFQSMLSAFSTYEKTAGIPLTVLRL